ncbi:MAG TPA: SMP-30/gluconolactonase/LRE family protein [Solirubrobacteraceae bacterium]
MVVEVDNAGFEQLIDPDEQLICIGRGYQFTEGPVWSPRDQSLYFSDIPSDNRWRWSERDGMTLDGSPTFKANGLALDAAGNLLSCEQVSSCVVRLDARRRRELLAFHHRGKYLNSPNDIVVRRDGTIYFTDPDYGRWNDWIGQERSRERDFRGVYRIAAEPDPTGEAELIVAEHEFDQPNGLCFSPDETILYVNDSPRAEIKAFTVAADGTLSDGRVLIDNIGHGFREEDSEELKRAQHREHHDQGALDGMKCDEYGNVWVTGPGGVWVISPAGERLGLIRAPEVAGNLTWGGDDLRTLFLMTTSTVHIVRTLVAPAPLVQHS